MQSINPIVEVDNHKMKVKLMDMMLQLIYQAKARLDSIGGQAGFSTKDAAFRAAFLFTRLKVCLPTFWQHELLFANTSFPIYAFSCRAVFSVVFVFTYPLHYRPR